MNPGRWERIHQIFYVASDMETSGREAFLDTACNGDPELRAEIESLLRWSGESGDIEIADSISQLAASAISSTPGDRIGNYELIRELGRGGMGSVFLAVRADDQFRKQVAIKVMNTAIARADMQARFRAERQILADLDHPNIARMLDGGSTPSGLPYVVMEHIDGLPIDEYCQVHSLGVRQKLILFRRLCDAITYAHRNLVVHRDIKPANVLVGTDGSPKLLDFGIARLIGESSATVTRVEERVLTPQYASPEQKRGEAITTATDIYSLGIVLYELLAGHVPEKADNPNLDKDLTNILLMAIRDEPSRRYQSVDQFSEDLRRYLDGFPVIARRDTWQYRTGKFLRRNRWSVAGVTVLASIVIGFGIGMALLARRVGVERDTASTERHNAEQISQFLIDSFRLADPSGQQGRTLTAQQVLDSGSERISRQLANQPAVRARVMNTIGEVYESLGLYDRAQHLLDDAAKTDSTVETLSSLGNLAEIKADFGAAESWYRKALAKEKRPAERAALQTKLGAALTGGGKFAEAEKILNESLASERRLDGPDSIPVAETLMRLGGLQTAENRPELAEPFLRQSLRIRRSVQGAENPDTVGTMTELAQTQAAILKFDEAEKLAKEALALHRKLYGDTHISVADDLYIMSSIKLTRGDYSEAAALIRQQIQIYSGALGPQSLQVAHALTWLGVILDRSGDLEGSEKAQRESLRMNAKLLGDSHPETLRIALNLAGALHTERKDAEAEAITARLVAQYRQDPTSSADLQFALATLSAIHRSTGNFRAAENEITEAAEMARQTSGPESQQYASCLYNHGATLTLLGKLKDGEAMFNQSIALQKKNGAKNTYSMSSASVGLARNLLLQGRAAEAEPLARENLRLLSAMPKTDWRYALGESVLGGCLAAQGRYDEAAPLITESHTVLIKYPTDRTLAAERHRLEDFNRLRH